MTRSVRRAETKDLAELLEIVERRRDQYARYEPVFWRPAANAVDVQRLYFRDLLDEAGAAVFVAVEDERVGGFLIASIADNPPVYDPGGGTCVVDDFAVAGDEDWSWAGPLLLEQVKGWAAARQAVQMVVVTGHRDDSKRGVLERSGLSLTSEWWTGPT
jgi:hypothetical protein